MQTLGVWLLAAFELAAATNPIVPAKITALSVPANNAAFFEAQRAGVPGVASLKAMVALPQGFDASRPWPLLIVTAPSGASAIQAWPGYTNVGLAQGWVVVAVDGPKVPVERDTHAFAQAIISALMEQLRRTWPQSKQWPIACAGFSGGAKRAAMTGAELMRRRENVIGVFMGGCNEDRATAGYQLSQPGVAFLNVPLFLSNGTQDSIAGPQHGATVKQSLERTGFRLIRWESYAGGHRLDTNHLQTALRWFRQQEKK